MTALEISTVTPAMTPTPPSLNAAAAGGPAQPGLDIAGLEAVYDALAQAIDQAGPDKTALLLVKLALLNAQALGQPERFQQHLVAALKDL